jgi:transcriptional regulator with GAF, ATPase, and Fis domain
MLKALNQGGIFRYLLKPWNIQDLRQTLDSAFEAYELRKKNITLINDLIGQVRRLQLAYNEINTLKEKLEEENIQLKDEFLDQNLTSEIVGKSKNLKSVLKQAVQAAKSNASILLLGETGTGKELFAKAIHSHSNRKDNLLVKINCAAIPETLIESELFGYERGAFTGANKLKYGKFEIAHKGTLFLDEIGELPLAVTKLLKPILGLLLQQIGIWSKR